MSPQDPTLIPSRRSAADRISEVLREHLPPGAPVLKTIQENVYHLSVGNTDYLIKWIADNNTFGQNELRIGYLLSKQANIPVPRLLFEKKVQGGVIAGWEFINGHDLRAASRHRLTEAFARLGQFHKAMRYSGDVYSPLSNHRFHTIQEMLFAETFRLTTTFSPEVRDRCREIITRLDAGYPTLIHGDMHPGNILLSRGRLWFVDWSYACFSLNLFDLDYIHSMPLLGNGETGEDELSWPIIRPQESASALKAYFHAAGLEHMDPFQAHQAVMVWNLLRSYENAEKNGYRAELEKVREQLVDLLYRSSP
jgi:hypothetical protein